MKLGLISLAYADGAAANPQQYSSMSTFLMLTAFIIIFYFLMMRPQQKRAKEHKKLLENLQVGDEVMIAGGIVGRVKKIKEEFCVISASETSELKVQKSSIASVLPKGTISGIENSN